MIGTYMSHGPIVARTLLHSTYVNDIGNGEDAVIVSEILKYEDGTTKPNLRKFKSPNTKFWITKPGLRIHPDKKEFEKMDSLDEYIVPYKYKDKEIFKALNGYMPNFISNKQRRELYQSPYLYGGNISIEALVAMKYKKDLDAAGEIAQFPTTGFFDIERSLLPSSVGKLPLMVFTAENRVFLAMKRSFMYEERDGKMTPVTVDEVRQAAHQYIDPLVESIFQEKGKDLEHAKDKLPFSYEFFVGDTEIEMIRWIFDRMHETKTSFIGIWNLGFDIPEIIKNLEAADIPLKDIFAHPDLRETGYGYAHYKEDKRDVHHYTQKWHWLSASAHFQFIDSMSLYSYIRQVDGKEPSYALDEILKKFGIGGKLVIDRAAELDPIQGTADWHRGMLSRFFLSYALYAMWDGMGLQIMEWLNNDLTAMMVLGGTTPPKFFPNQTIRVTNTMFEQWLPEKQVLGTGVDIESIRDDDLITEGGAVLRPQNLVANGVALFKDWPTHKTKCFFWQNDLDFSAQYPSNALVLNISKQTKLGTIFSIKGAHVTKKYSPERSVEVFCSYYISPKANSVEMGVEFFNLPGYKEMNELFKTETSK